MHWIELESTSVKFKEVWWHLKVLKKPHKVTCVIEILFYLFTISLELWEFLGQLGWLMENSDGSFEIEKELREKTLTLLSILPSTENSITVC